MRNLIIFSGLVVFGFEAHSMVRSKVCTFQSTQAGFVHFIATGVPIVNYSAPNLTEPLRLTVDDVNPGGPTGAKVTGPLPQPWNAGSTYEIEFPNNSKFPNIKFFDEAHQLIDDQGLICN